MTSLLIVTGPPGAGKSTLARELAARCAPSVLVEGDAFFAFLASGAIEPWLPEADEQNTVVTEAAGAAAGRYARDYDTFYDGVVGPWFLPTFAAASGLRALDYLVLLPPVEVCIARMEERTGHGFHDEPAARHMHAQFSGADIEDRHVVDAVVAVEELVGHVSGAHSRQDLRYEISA